MKNTQVVAVLLLLAILGVQVYSTFVKKESFEDKEDRHYSNTPTAGGGGISYRGGYDGPVKDPVRHPNEGPAKKVVVSKKTLDKPVGNSSGGKLRAMNSDDLDPHVLYANSIAYVTSNTQEAIDKVQKSSIYYPPNKVQTVYDTIPDKYKAAWLASLVLYIEGSNIAPIGFNSYDKAGDIAAAGCGSFCNPVTGYGGLMNF